jgi:hypothetical protein
MQISHRIIAPPVIKSTCVNDIIQTGIPNFPITYLVVFDKKHNYGIVNLRNGECKIEFANTKQILEWITKEYGNFKIVPTDQIELILNHH